MHILAVVKPDEPCFVIADPSLVDARGHHYSLSRLVTKGALSWGLRVIWFTHKDFIHPDLIADVKIYPVFTSTMYDRYRRNKSSQQPNNLDDNLLNELKYGLTQAGICSRDHVFFHTGFGDIFRAVTKYMTTSAWKQNPYLHICTPYDLSTIPGREPGSPLQDVFENLRTLEPVDKKVFFWAETPQLASHFTISYGFNVRALPLPPPVLDKTNLTEKDNDCVTALYLGPAREEKGFLQLPEIVGRLYENDKLKGKIKFVIQCTPQIVGYTPNIKAAIKKLASFPESFVKLIDTVLSEQEYNYHLLAADVLLLLYDEKNYKIRGSGIAVEAISSGKCILTQKSTFCASLITHGGGAAVEGIDEAIQFLIDLVSRRDEYCHKAQLQGQAYREEKSVEKYVGRIIDQTQACHSVPFFPSSVVGHVSPTLLRCY